MTHFETVIKASDRYNTSNAFINAGISNAIVHGLERVQNIPKMVVLVLENDIINSVEKGKYAVIFYNRMIADIIKDCKKAAGKLSKLLPVNAKRTGWPKLIFIMPTLHRYFNDYDDRRTFIESLEKTVKEHKNVWVMKLLQVWDENNANFFYHEQQRYSGAGLNALWQAVDKTIAYCSRKITRDNLKYEKLNQLGYNECEEDKPDKYSQQFHNRYEQNSRGHKRFWSARDDRVGTDRYRLPNPF